MSHEPPGRSGAPKPSQAALSRIRATKLTLALICAVVRFMGSASAQFDGDFGDPATQRDGQCVFVRVDRAVTQGAADV